MSGHQMREPDQVRHAERTRDAKLEHLFDLDTEPRALVADVKGLIKSVNGWPTRQFSEKDPWVRTALPSRSIPRKHRVTRTH